MVAKIAGTFKDWIIDGIKFNDELVRAKTFFTSLGLLGMKGAAGSEITVAEASASSNIKIKQAYEKSSIAAEEMMNRMMAVSALTGQDLGEIVSSARQSMTDLLNKVNKSSGGKTNAFLENPKMFGDVAERMVKLASVLRMADPQNRKLGFHMVGLQELFSGSTGGKKDSGLQNVLSLLRREGIKIEQGVATEITKMVNKGDITGAMDKVEDALSRAGLGMVQLENMLHSTLQPAIDGTIMYARIFNRIFTKVLYENSMKPFFRALLKTSDAVFKNKSKMAVLEKLGETLSKVTDPILFRFTQLIDFIQGGYSDPTALRYVNNTISTVAGIIDVMMAFSEVMIAFIAGLMGQANSKGLKDLSRWIRDWTSLMFKAGKTTRWFIESAQALDTALGGSIKTIAVFIFAVMAIVAVISGIGLIILGIVAPVLGFVVALRRLAIIAPIAKEVIMGIIEALAAARGGRAASSVAPNIDLSRGAAQARGAQNVANAAAPDIDLRRGAAQASGAQNVANAAARPGLIARAMPYVTGAMAAGQIASVIKNPYVLAAIAAVAVAAAGTYYYNSTKSRETGVNQRSPNKQAAARVVAPTPSTINKNTNNATVNVSVNVQSGSSPKEIGQSVGDRVSEAFKSIFSPRPI
jgi:hypothetical protein